MRPCVRAPFRRRTLRLWLLLLGFTAVSVMLTDLLNQNQYQNWTEAKTVVPLRPLERFASPPELEVIVDSRDAASERERDVPPLDSLHEDQLLFVPSASGTKHSAQQQTKRSYKLLMPGQSKEPSGSAPETREERGPEQSARTEKVPLRRGLPESRAPGCLGEQYSESLPSTSVVICFRDESWSTLLRTVHSVLDTAPPQHLRELLLVDDHSQPGELKSALTQYVSRLKGVRLIRSPRQLGVGGCRSLGASRATGEVLVFMDPHCECQRGWLEPLLERVAQDRTRVVSPLMDVIDPQTLQYSASQWPLRGVWDWRLDFHWDHSALRQQQKEEQEEEQEEQEDTDILPLKSPVLGGEVLALDRHFFDSIGAYDPGTLLWGPQQVELSIRVWSCGGSLEVVPCSRVAHLRVPSPLYDPPDEEQLQRDKIRVAEAWMGQYRGAFYSRDTLAHFIRQSEAPNITERLQLKRSLGCRDFHWYLSSVYPQLYVPQDQPGRSGELYNVGSGSCVDYPRGEGLHRRDVVTVPCSGTGAQHCDLNSEGELRWGLMGDLCLDAAKEKVFLSPCARERAASQHWSFRKVSGQLVHSESQLCLEAVNVPGQEGLGAVGAVGAQAGVGAVGAQAGVGAVGAQAGVGAVGAQAGVGAVGAQAGVGAVGGVLLRPCSHLPTQQWSFEQLVDPDAS